MNEFLSDGLNNKEDSQQSVRISIAAAANKAVERLQKTEEAEKRAASALVAKITASCNQGFDGVGGLDTGARDPRY